MERWPIGLDVHIYVDDRSVSWNYNGLSGATGYLRNPYFITDRFEKCYNEPQEVDFFHETPNVLLSIMGSYYNDLLDYIDDKYNFSSLTDGDANKKDYSEFRTYVDAFGRNIETVIELSYFRTKPFTYLFSNPRSPREYPIAILEIIKKAFSKDLNYVVLWCSYRVENKQHIVNIEIYDLKENVKKYYDHRLRYNAYGKLDRTDNSELIKYFNTDEYLEIIDFMLLGCELQSSGKHPKVSCS